MAGRRRVSGVAVMAAALLAAAGAPAGHAAGPEDFTGDVSKPVVHSFEATPVNADVTDAPATFTFTTRVTDDLSGVTGVSLGFDPPGEETTYYGGHANRISGDDRDGVYRGTFTVPRYARPGDWRIQLSTGDRVGNGVNLQAEDLEARGWVGRLKITDANPDGTPPQITSLKVTPEVVDVTGGPADVEVELTATDSQSGIKWVLAFLSGRNGRGGAEPIHFALVSGTEQSGTWRGRSTIPRYAPNGAWEFDFRVWDRLDNVKTLEGDDLAALGLPPGFDVVSPDEDVEAPRLREYSMSPIEVNVHDADQPVRIRTRWTDDKSGLRSWVGDRAYHQVQASVSDPVFWQDQGTGYMRLTSGTVHDGVLEGTITIPKSSATGLRPVRLYAEDAIYNSRYAAGADLAAAGGVPALLVYNTPLPPIPIGADPLNGGALVKWDPPPDERGAEVTEYVVEEAPQGLVERVDGDARSAVVDGLTNDVHHTFTIKAVNKAGPSDPSDQVGTTPRVGAPPPSNPAAPAQSGYWMVGADGAVYAFGDATWHGNAAVVPGVPAVDIEPTPARDGYWVVDAGGQVVPFGAARYFGNAGWLWPGERVTSMSATPKGGGYWLFTSRGRVLTFGDAPHLGDMAGVTLNGPVLDSVPTPSGRGYYMVASDGGVFAFGDARFQGSMGGRPLNRPVESLVPDADGWGYWLVASDGGVFAFGAAFLGSMGSVPLNRPVTGMVGSRTGRGYLMVAEDGGIFSFGDAPFRGSLGAHPPPVPITAAASL